LEGKCLPSLCLHVQSTRPAGSSQEFDPTKDETPYAFSDLKSVSFWQGRCANVTAGKLRINVLEYCPIWHCVHPRLIPQILMHSAQCTIYVDWLRTTISIIPCPLRDVRDHPRAVLAAPGAVNERCRDATPRIWAPDRLATSPRLWEIRRGERKASHLGPASSLERLQWESASSVSTREQSETLSLTLSTQ
jgi:hypothetical protein